MILLRPINETDCELVKKWLNTDEYQQLIKGPLNIKNFDCNNLKSLKDRLYIFQPFKKQPLGFCEMIIEQNHKRIALNIFMSENSTLLFNAKSMFLALKKSFHDLKTHKVMFFVDERNKNMRKILQKSNILMEGYIPNYYKDNDNYYRMEIYSLLEDEFEDMYLKQKTSSN